MASPSVPIRQQMHRRGRQTPPCCSIRGLSQDQFHQIRSGGLYSAPFISLMKLNGSGWDDGGGANCRSEYRGGELRELSLVSQVYFDCWTCLFQKRDLVLWMWIKAMIKRDTSYSLLANLGQNTGAMLNSEI
jgi:hypothetical protein